MSLAHQLFGDRGRSVGEVEKEMMSHMDAAEAARRLDGKLPQEVASLVAKVEERKETPGKLNDKDIERAISILNKMVEDAWVRLDIKITECKEFESRNRDTYEQVMIDLARLGSQIAEAEGDRAQAQQDISEIKSGMKQIKEAKAEALAQYTLVFNKNSDELSKRESERAVWNFIMQVTNCETFGDTYAANTFLQLNDTKVCENDKHEKMLVFADPKVQARLESLLTPESRKELHLMLAKHSRNRAFFQQPVNATVPAELVHVPTLPVNPSPPTGNGQWKKCSPGEPNCGLLHDTISLQWGGYRDLVDDLKAEMAKNLDEWNIQLANYNDQLRLLRDAEKKANKELADAIKRIDIDTEEKNKKNQEKLELEVVYTKRMKICKAEIAEILYTFICGVKVTRNVLITQHTTIKIITDCDVTDWNPGPCTVPCDDSCPVLNDPNACGGTHTLTRVVINTPDEWGIKCPALSTVRRCSQRKCPVDCLMSQWSGWSACAKECGGGMQGRTRDILVPPKNGGVSCEADADSRACNTHSCDRDCLLSDWTRWTGCSMACGGGTRSRKKLVTRPIRGNGECPRTDSADRFESEECNAQACYGDEVCIAQQDLILAIDASGSVKDSGFKAIQKFARNLTARYKPKYYGQEAMKVGVVGYGNGEVSPAGLISPALAVHGMTFETNKLQESIAKMEWLRGFTNMAQALIKADELLGRGSRKEAHSGILLITDGRSSLEWQTTQKADALKAKNIMIYAAVISSSETDEYMTQMKKWVSSPWDSNLVRIPSHAALQADPEVFVQEALAKFCPYSMSPTQNMQDEGVKQYILIKRGAYPSDDCGEWIWRGYVQDINECVTLARQAGYYGFAWGKERRENACYSEAIPVDQAIWDEWIQNREDPPCPKGAWVETPFYDSYIMNPASMEEHDALAGKDD